LGFFGGFEDVSSGVAISLGNGRALDTRLGQWMTPKQLVEDQAIGPKRVKELFQYR